MNPTNKIVAANGRSKCEGGVSRREVLGTTAAVAAALAFPMIIPSRVLGADAPSNRIRVGQIGAGRIGSQHDIPGVIKSNLADYVAACDLDSKSAANGPAPLARARAHNNA